MTQTTLHPFESSLSHSGANYVPLTPVSFLNRAAKAFAEETAVIDGGGRQTYGQLFERCRRLASAQARRNVQGLHTAILASNIPEMIEMHHAISMLGAVLNPLRSSSSS
jgi:fatty-acyl-CoA synthase